MGHEQHGDAQVPIDAANFELWTEPFRDAVQESQRQGRCRTDLTADDVAVILMGLVDGLAVRCLIDPQTMTLDQLENRLFVATTAVLGIDDADRIGALQAMNAVKKHTGAQPLTPELAASVLGD